MRARRGYGRGSRGHRGHRGRGFASYREGRRSYFVGKVAEHGYERGRGRGGRRGRNRADRRRPSMQNGGGASYGNFQILKRGGAGRGAQSGGSGNDKEDDGAIGSGQGAVGGNGQSPNHLRWVRRK